MSCYSVMSVGIVTVIDSKHCIEVSRMENELLGFLLLEC